MTLQECYAAIGGDYESVVARLRSETLVKKFIFKFLDDTSCEDLHKALEDGNYKEAFRAAHTIKGVCQNLGFEKLFSSSSELAEDLRDGVWKDEYMEAVSRMEKDYQQTVDGIQKLKEEENQ